MVTFAAGAADAACFAPDTALPTHQEIVGDPHLGRTARDLALALLAGDLATAQRLLDGDGALAHLPVGQHHDMLSLAIASCEERAIALVLSHGASPDGVHPGVPLELALHATRPDFAYRLLQAGAAPQPAADRAGPLTTAIELNSLAGVRMLLDFHADPNVAERTGNRPLQSAIDMEHFRIAELLLDRGADPWALDGSGGNLGSSLAEPMVSRAPAEAAARARLIKRLGQMGWPQPTPAPRAVRALALADKWPPPAARARGAEPPSEELLALLRRRHMRP